MTDRKEISQRIARGTWLSRSRPGVALVLLLLLVHAATAADGGSPSDTRAVGESLESMGNLPWYDQQSGGVEPVAVRPQIDDSVNRDSRWRAKRKSRGAAPSGSSAGGGTSRQPPGSTAEVVGWVVVGVLMGLVVTLLVYTFLRIDDAPTAIEGSAGEVERSEDLQARMENLPIDVCKPVGDLLQEADRLGEAGRIDEAIIYLFGHRLLQLDRHHAIRLARGKTNRQYLSELDGRRELQHLVRETINLFEKSYFGRYAVAWGEFDQVRSRQAELESLLARMREAA